MRLRTCAAALVLASIAWYVEASAPAPQVGEPASAPSVVAAHQATLKRYCFSCHTERQRAAGSVPVALDALDAAHVDLNSEAWERVVRKLRTGEMPPAGLPRPDAATNDTLAIWLEHELDRGAVAHPNPGRQPLVHRLNRAEYHNAIRDLLGLDVDVAAQLPADDMSYGFDNIAGVLKVTPSLLDRYMAASRQISRLAIGDPTLAPTAETFRLKADLSQEESFDDLPLGTRGGAAIRYQFPLDADYVIKVEPLGGGADAHDLEVSVDGARVRLFTLKPRSGLGLGQGYDSEGEALDTRVPLKAGPHVVGVTFVKKTP